MLLSRWALPLAIFAVEALKLGYLTALLIFSGMIALVTVVYYLVRAALNRPSV